MNVTSTLNHPPVLEVPAQRFRQGDRTVFQFVLTVEKFDDVLPEHVDVDVIGDNNRRFTPSHAELIENYLRTVDEWVLGTVTLSISEEHIGFEPYDGQDHSNPAAIGMLRINAGSRANLKILDGQHRRWAIRNYRIKGVSDPEERARQKRFENSHMPVTLYIEGDSIKLRQMFADMAQQRNMDAITKALFNGRDPFNPAAAQIMTDSAWLKPFVEMNSPTVTRKSDKLLSFNQLVDNLKTLKYGYYGWPKQIPFNDESAEFHEVVEIGLHWVDEFLPDARAEYADLRDFGDDIEHLADKRLHTLAYGATMLRYLAATWHDWGILHPKKSRDKLAKFISRLPCKPRVQRGFWVENGALVPGKPSLSARRQDVSSTVRVIIREAAKL